MPVFQILMLLLVVNSANGPFGLLTKLFRIPTAINVDGLEWLRPKWKGLGSIYFKWASKMATLFYDQIINDSDEMRKVYLIFLKEIPRLLLMELILENQNPHNLDLDKPMGHLKQREYYLVSRKVNT